MSENIIYCYSGSGHCLNMAKSIAAVLGDTDIVMMRAFPEKTDATEAKRVGFVFPCYGGGLPGDVESYVKASRSRPTPTALRWSSSRAIWAAACTRSMRSSVWIIGPPFPTTPPASG